eukprot:6211903-Pleurochrysis_carterae.AAC.4
MDRRRVASSCCPPPPSKQFPLPQTHTHIDTDALTAHAVTQASARISSHCAALVAELVSPLLLAYVHGSCILANDTYTYAFIP